MTTEMDYPLPADTRRALESGAKGLGSPGLVFDRYPTFLTEWTLDGPQRKKILDRVCGAARDPAYGALVRTHHRRWAALTRASGGSSDCSFTARADSRLVIGLGRGGTTDTGFTFHRLYGFPYLPGSALKGLTQAFALFEAAERLRAPQLAALNGGEVGAADERREILRGLESELMDSESPDGLAYRAVFGGPGGVGRVVFFDAVPIEPPGLAVDVMNPHYAGYYGGFEPPAGYLSPVPVYFLAVEAGARFAFAVGVARAALMTSADEGVGAARQAATWLRGALTTMGTGAKTGAGYGYWTLERA